MKVTSRTFKIVYPQPFANFDKDQGAIPMSSLPLVEIKYAMLNTTAERLFSQVMQ